ncbi:MAG TPA: glycosyltransferase [Bryobacteraceae bacterium]|jgi:L-malate glycosyltransferase|nr:glycosyltransferase [Bryobacteraceae bacterium]
MPWPVMLLARELDLGGSERQMTEIAKTLDRSRFTPHVGCFRPQGMRAPELAAAGVPVVHFPVDSFASLGALSEARRLRSYIREHGIRLVHTFDYPLTLFAVPVAHWFTNAVVVSSQRSHRELIPARYRRLIQLTDRMADAIVVNCEFVRRHLELDEGVPRDRMRLCYNGVDLETFRPGPERRDAVTIGVVCALRPEKDLGTLIDAFARLDRKDWRLRIAGSGSMLSELRSQASAKGLSADCIFASATADAAECMRDIDIFVLPSRSEAFSNSLLEAMACGCCPVASRVGGNPELVRHGENGMLFEGGQASELSRVLSSLMTHRVLREQLAARARSIAEGFSIHASARRMEEIYTELIERASN